MNEKSALLWLCAAYTFAGMALGKDALVVSGSVFGAAALVCNYMGRLKREQER